MSCGDVFLGLIAIIFPPIAVWIKRGLCSADSLINILLCMLGYVPGLLHAWYIIAKNPEINYDYEPVRNAEEGRVTYYYVSQDGTQQQRNYGTHAGTGQARVGGAQGGQRQAITAGPPVNKSSKPKSASQQQRQALLPSGSQAGGSSAAAGSDEGNAPPSYAEVVRGDNKIQTDQS